MTHPRSAFGAPPQGGAAIGPAEPDPRRLLEGSATAVGGPLISIQDLRVAFRMGREQARVHAVRGISFDINEHSTVALVGESGSGKSVTAMSISMTSQDLPARDFPSRRRGSGFAGPLATPP